MKPEISVVVVNWNSGAHLRANLDALFANMPGAWDVAVIDNQSSDGSEGFTRKRGPNCRLIRNRRNRGFGAAVNQGLSKTRGPLVFIVNPHCLIESGTVESLAKTIGDHDDCAVAGPRVFGDTRLGPGAFGRSSLLGRLFPPPGMTSGPLSDEELETAGMTVEVDWVSGACMLARRDALRAVGGFDERYFLYWEDADLCCRLRQVGWTVRYVPEARIQHVAGGPRRKPAPSAVRVFHDSAFLYYATHVAPGRWNPKRSVARVLLRARCRWELGLRGGEDAEESES